MSKRAQLVYPGFWGGWNVKTYGASRAAKNFESQSDAIAWAKSRCKRQGFDLYVHNWDGSVRYMKSYRKPSPVPPK